MQSRIYMPSQMRLGDLEGDKPAIVQIYSLGYV